MKEKKLVITMQPTINRGTASDDVQTANDLVHKMNWKLLKAQKIVLSNLQSKKSINGAESETIEGLLNLIDTIQDIAVDRYGYPSGDVFNHDSEMSLKYAKTIVSLL